MHTFLQEIIHTYFPHLVQCTWGLHECTSAPGSLLKIPTRHNLRAVRPSFEKIKKRTIAIDEVEPWICAGHVMLTNEWHA